MALQQLRAQTQPLRLGQSLALTGPLSDVGQAIHDGGRACFIAVNARGGINGQLVELVARDDAYQVTQAVVNVEAFIAAPSIFSLYTSMGTPMVAATLPQVKQSCIPYFTPLPSAMQARPLDMRNVFNVRASYPQEAEELVKHLVTICLRNIAEVHQNKAFGKEVFESARAALAESTLTIEELAQQANLSTFHFAKMFRVSMGLPPHGYVAKRRVERAKHLLRVSPSDLAGIALECGYASQSHFTRAFKVETGATPGAWRRLH